MQRLSSLEGFSLAACLSGVPVHGRLIHFLYSKALGADVSAQSMRLTVSSRLWELVILMKLELPSAYVFSPILMIVGSYPLQWRSLF